MEQDQSWKEFVQSMSEVAEIMNQNAYRIYVIYAPIVENLCRRMATEDEVDHCFDILLDYAYDEKIMGLFKKLSRHYYKIYPDSVSFYVKDCIEMWCEESGKEQNDIDIDNE